MNKFFISIIASLIAFSAVAQEKLIILNEGLWQSDNGKVSYFENGSVVSNSWFRDRNNQKIGDTPEDIIQVQPNLIAISVNWSNIVEFIDATGLIVAETEDIPNCRKLATDGNYVYITSYGHECTTVAGDVEFEKGFVAKISLSTFQVVEAVEVGYEPEGIAYYNGYLFVANTGGYAGTEGDHEYETTVTILDANTLEKVRDVDTGCINLYGVLSQSGQYLCINSCGDYYSIEAATVIFDCQAALDGKDDADCCVSLPFAATYNTTNTDGTFFIVGSQYSFTDGGYAFNYATIDPAAVISSSGTSGISYSMPGTVDSDFESMSQPYGIYVNPYTGYIYGTDAGAFTDAGKLYQWDPKGNLLGTFKLYINPGHFLALNPNGEDSITDITSDATTAADAPIYNLRGIRVERTLPGNLYIQSGHKFIAD